MNSVRNLPTILVVDDDPTILLIVRMLLRRMTGLLKLISVYDSQQALAIIQSRPVPLLITDYSMPGITGLELAAAAKQHNPTTCVVMVSALDTEELRQRAREIGVDTVMPKPFPFDRFEAIIRDVVQAASPTSA